MNKYFGAAVLFVLAATVNAVTPRNKFEAGVLKVIEKCKSGDVWSLPLPFPSLSPLIMPPRTSYDGRFTFYVGEKKVYGLENLSVDELSTSPSQMLMLFSVPRLQIRADKYHLQSEPLIFFRLVDDVGSFGCDVEDVKVLADVRFGARGANTVITHLDLSYSIGDIQVYLSGSSQLVNNRVRTKMWNRLYSSETKERIQNAIKDRASNYLQGHTPEEFRRIISSI